MKRKKYKTEPKHTLRKVLLILFAVIAAFFAGLFVVYPASWLWTAIVSLFSGIS